MTVVGVILIMVFGLTLFFRSSRSRRQQYSAVSPTVKPKRQTIIARDLLLQGEQRFFSMLCAALPEYHVFPQVSFSALITHAPHIYGTYITTVRRQFHHKYVDFVICERGGMKVLAVVEYDGRGHNSKNDAYRDDMLRSVGYRVERFDRTDTLASVKARFGWNLPASIEELKPVAEQATQSEPKPNKNGSIEVGESATRLHTEGTQVF